MLQIYRTKIGESARIFFANKIRASSNPNYKYILPSRLLISEVKKQGNISACSMDDLVYDLLNTIKPNTYKKSSPYIRTIILTKIVSELHAKNHLLYFHNIIEDKTFISNLANLLGNFSLNYIDSDEFIERLNQTIYSPENTINVQSDKLQDLAKIYKAYQITLDDLQLTDVFSGYLQLERLLSTYDGSMPWQEIYVSDFYSFTPVEQSILKKLSKYLDVHLALSYDPERKKTFKSINLLFEIMSGLSNIPVIEHIDSSPSSSAFNYLANNIFITDCAQLQSIDSAISVHGFYSKTAELDFVANDIKKELCRGLDFSSLLICLRSMNEYQNLKTVLNRNGIPSSLPTQVLMRHHFLFRLLIDFLSLGYGKFDKNSLQKFICSAPIVFALDLPKDLLEKTFLEHRISSFKDIYQQLSLLSEDITIEKIKSLETIINKIPHTGNISDFIACLEGFFDDLNIVQSIGRQYKHNVIDLDSLKGSLEVYKQTFDFLQEMGKVDVLLYGNNHKLSLKQFTSDLIQALSDKAIQLQEGNQNAIKILIASDVQGFTADNVYVLGMNEGTFPQYRKDNWLLTNFEYNALQIFDGSINEQAMSEDAFFLANVLSTPKSKLTITYLENENSRRSKYIAEIQKVCPSIECQSNFDLLPNHLDNIYNYTGMLNFLSFSKNTNSAVLPDSANAYLTDKLGNSWISPSLSSTPLDFNIVEKILSPGYCFSVTQLEMYLQCPFKFLLSYIWKIKDWQVLEDDNTPITKGNFFHKVTETFMQQYLSQSLPTKEVAQQSLLSVFNNLYENVLTENEHTWQLERDENLHLLQEWLNVEYKNINDFKPYLTEWTFGTDNKSLKIAGFTINGKIDRIDITNNKIRIIDYKLNRFPNSKDALTSNQNLQMQIYTLAAYRNLGKEISSCCYYSFKQKKYSTYLCFEESNLKINMIDEYLTNILNEIRRNVTFGNFNPVKNANCQYCEYSSICRIDNIQINETEGDTNE